MAKVPKITSLPYHIKVFYKLVVLLLLVIARHAQSTQNCKFVISLQYLKKEGRDEVVHEDKHQIMLQVDTGGHGQVCPNYTKYQVYRIFVISEERSEGWSWFFLPMSITVIYKSTLSFLVGVVRHSYSAQNNKCAVSLQYLKKQLSYEVYILHADKVFYKLIVLFFMDLAKHAAISLWYLKKEVRNEVRNLTALVGSNATHTVYYTSNVLPLLTFFVSWYGIHTKLFLHLINCLCNISSLLFQVMVGPCKLACLKYFWGLT